MKLQTQPNRWSCTVTAFSMLMDLELSEVYELLGHDGSEILWPEQEEPLCRRGVHIEELQYVASEYGEVLVPYVPGFMYAPNGQGKLHCFSAVKFRRIMERHDGLLFGKLIGQKNGHCVAWNAERQVIYDPAGRIIGYSDFNIESFYARFSTGSRTV